MSPFAAMLYGLARVSAVRGLPRLTHYAQRYRRTHPVESRKRGRGTCWTDDALTERTRGEIAAPPFIAEGRRKVWALLRVAGLSTSKARALLLMRHARLPAPQSLALQTPAENGGFYLPKSRGGTSVCFKPLDNRSNYS